jgi:hypothetical protein
MQSLTLLDPTKTGRQAGDPENQLHHSIVGQEEAIRQIVSVYQTHLAGLSPAGRSGTFYSEPRFAGFAEFTEVTLFTGSGPQCISLSPFIIRHLQVAEVLLPLGSRDWHDAVAATRGER